MAIRYLVDTNVLVHLKKSAPTSRLRTRIAEHAVGDLALSVVTEGELLFGVEKSPDPARSRALLDSVFAYFTILPVTSEAARAYAVIRADLARRGAMIGNNDLWIAAQAIASDLPLVTNNVREFARVSGLQVEDWTAP
ncbi:type II toxin-antitoxin system VapC family toxin [Chthonobacter rhizosphaerae]|uniref:type II toxin-antitoxin system VapC family toxin n=1 Tax=Chthonobacter rhizosphaerae TaxID=2735553 RepID=UPI001AED48D4|nr:type II toxin-antitoxin system VapC family toxin [Chthonobacter rhizosphaerae]